MTTTHEPKSIFSIIKLIEKENNNRNHEKAAEIAAKELNISLKVEFLKNDYHFDGDKDKRDIYKCTIIKGLRNYTFNFGQSLQNSGEYQVVKHLQNKIWVEQTTGGKIHLSKEEFQKLKYIQGIEKDILKNPNFKAPTMYDVLTCLQKYDVGTFDDFCSEFGYSEDSRKAEKTYKAVLEEYNAMRLLFSDEELQILSYIQ
jgi:hypothetical protein